MYEIVFLTVVFKKFLCCCNSLVCSQPWAAAFWVLQLRRLKGKSTECFLLIAEKPL